MRIGVVYSVPGIVRRTRKDGSIAVYWIAANCSRKAAGYPVKVVRLHGNRAEQLKLAYKLYGELQTWLAGEMLDDLPLRFDGTIASLIEHYERHELSPYRTIKWNSRDGYDVSLKALRKAVGARALRALNGVDFIRWYDNFAKGKDRRHPARAHRHMSMLRRLFRWGVVLELPECKRLIGILDEMEFKQSKPRTVFLTYDHAVAIIARANEIGRPSIALAQALQFETALRQRDVIGEWEPGEEKPSSGVTLTSPNGRRNRRWANGLTWSHIGSDGVLRKTTTKTATAIEVPVSLCPLVEQEIGRTPIERRVGPMIVNEKTGLPFTQNTFRTVWREIADAAGVPKSVWNMDSRAGSITEATDAGADLEKARHHAGHKNASMTARYSRKTLEKTAEVARLRMEHRRKKKGP